jgi:hypothetical protein
MVNRISRWSGESVYVDQLPYMECERLAEALSAPRETREGE